MIQEIKTGNSIVKYENNFYKQMYGFSYKFINKIKRLFIRLSKLKIKKIKFYHCINGFYRTSEERK
jgi:hypothetical protein